MYPELFDFEKEASKVNVSLSSNLNVDLETRYDKGFSRVITESGSYKVALIKDLFSKDNYVLQPDYQRRKTWSDKKKSKLIESFIINIPIPPIFIYEYEYDKYEVMDGLQRLSSIIDFYGDKFVLSGLEEWSDLNGKHYSELPEKIREGIDRRQLQVITVLKESAANDPNRADQIKRLVFERLNTGGIKLTGQEVRNATLHGPGNKLCLELSESKVFRTLWGIPSNIEKNYSLFEDSYESENDNIYSQDLFDDIEKNLLYRRMGDVELVLRFFAMRYINDFNYGLIKFLDDTLVKLNSFSEKDLNELKNVFIFALNNANVMFGENAFKYYRENKWSKPAKMIYDPLLLVLSQRDIKVKSSNIDSNINKLKEFYVGLNIDDPELFNGKHQRKENILNRASKFDAFIREKIV